MHKMYTSFKNFFANVQCYIAEYLMAYKNLNLKIQHVSYQESNINTSEIHTLKFDNCYI